MDRTQSDRNVALHRLSTSPFTLAAIRHYSGRFPYLFLFITVIVIWSSAPFDDHVELTTFLQKH